MLETAVRRLWVHCPVHLIETDKVLQLNDILLHHHCHWSPNAFHIAGCTSVMIPSNNISDASQLLVCPSIISAASHNHRQFISWECYYQLRTGTLCYSHNLHHINIFYNQELLGDILVVSLIYETKQENELLYTYVKGISVHTICTLSQQCKVWTFLNFAFRDTKEL